MKSSTVLAAFVFGSTAVAGQALPVGDADRICEVPNDTASLALWSEVRSAMRSAVNAAVGGRMRLTVRLHRQLLDHSARVVNETDSVATDLTTLPISSAHPEQLLQSDVVVRGPDGEWTYFSPTPEMLLDDRFLESHCVWQVSPEREASSLRFAPREHVEHSTVAGAVSFDGSTGELERIEFVYVNDPSGVRDSLLGGQLEFARNDSGPWFVSSWKVRTPILLPSVDSTGVWRYVGVEQVGASAVEVSDEVGNVVWTDESVAVLSGSVYDSVTGAPLPGALVAISGTEHWAATDDGGEFFLAGKLDGSYHLVFGHPRLDSLGFVSQPTRVDLRPGEASGVALSVPSLQSILGARCDGSPPAGSRRTLIGIVHDAETSRPVPGALVTVSRALIPEGLQQFANDRVENSVRTDSLGMYALCGVPVGETLVVNAVRDTRSSVFTNVTFGPGTVVIGETRPHSLKYPVARFDMDLVESAAHSGSIAGIVVDDATGEALSNVEVQLDGTLRTTHTDENGAFQFSGVPQGAVWLAFRKLGYRMLRRSASMTRDEHLVFSGAELRLERTSPDAVTLDPIVVEAQSTVPTATGFEDRRDRGFGSFLTRDEFEEWNPSVPTDLLRRMRGIRVLPNPLYGINGDTRRYQIVPSRDIGQRITRISPSRADLATGIQGAAVTECPILLFLDGVYLGDSQTTDVDNMIGMSALAAIEFYSPSQVPPRFALPGSTCGVAVFWSR